MSDKEFSRIKIQSLDILKYSKMIEKSIFENIIIGLDKLYYRLLNIYN